MTVLVLTGSARQDSYTRLVGAAVVEAVPGAVLADRLTVLPFFDEDLESAPPAEVEALRAQVREADAVVVVTPEYNGTIPGLLGNAVDWLSRPYGAGVLQDKRVATIAASPGGVGGARALVSLRTVLGNAGATLVGAGELVPEVNLRVAGGHADDVLRTQLQQLAGQLGAVGAQAA